MNGAQRESVVIAHPGIKAWAKENQPPARIETSQNLTVAIFLLQAQGGGSAFSLLFTFASIGLVFYFLVFRPQQQQQRRQKEMLADLKIGDRVVTRGGIRGTIVALKEKEGVIHLRVPPEQVKLEVLRNAIETVERPDEEQK